MSTYLISDIHGDLDRWNEMKSLINFSEKDKIIIIGDVADRGEHGVEIFQEIMSTNNIHLLLGNHELMLIQAEITNDKDSVNNWYMNGGQPTARALYDLPDHGDSIVNYLRHKIMTKAKTKASNGRMFYLAHGFVHGHNDDDTYNIVWYRPDRCENPNLGDYTLVCGHTPVINYYYPHELIDTHQSHARIMHTPYYINIDCGCGHSDARSCLGCLRIDDMAEFYVK